MNVEEYMFPESNKLHVIKCKEEHYPDIEYDRYLMELIDIEMVRIPSGVQGDVTER